MLRCSQLGWVEEHTVHALMSLSQLAASSQRPSFVRKYLHGFGQQGCGEAVVVCWLDGGPAQRDRPGNVGGCGARANA